MSALMVPFYEKLMKISYNLPKLDIVAVPNLPNTVSAEPWGVIILEEKMLIDNSVNSSSSDRVHTGKFLAQVLARQWFGGLVTMEWWSDVWLNDGAANYLAQFAASSCIAGLDAFKLFFVEVTQRAFSFDSTTVTYPLSISEATSLTDEKFHSFFDAVAYSKVRKYLRFLHRLL